MSYLNLPGGIPKFSKAVISLWFRVPQESIDAAFKQSDEADAYSRNLRGIIPLLTFGGQGTVSFYSGTFVGTDWVVTLLASGKTSPSFIGVDCSDSCILKSNIQYTSGGTSEPTSAGDPNIASPDAFAIGQGSTPINVAADRWHHVLVSFDMTNGCSTTFPGDGSLVVNTTCKFWLAFDDADYNGKHLQDLGFGYSGDPNGIVSNWCRAYPGNAVTEPIPANASFAAGDIPTSSHPMGVPADAGNSDFVYRVEMAELQIFTDVSLDTSIQGNRRAFVNNDGEPVNPTGTKDDPAPAVKLLGKKPDVLLNGSDDWKQGYNTGTLGIKIETDGSITKLPGGQFKPTGGIEQYKPDPSL